MSAGAGLAEQVHQALLAHHPSPATAAADEVAVMVRDHAPLLAAGDVETIARTVLHRVHGLGALEPFFADPAVSEIMVNGPGPVWLEREGQLVRTDVHLDMATLNHVVERVVAPLGRRLDRASPFVDGRLADGSRVHVAVPPLAVDGPYLTIRRFGRSPVPLSAVTTPGCAALLHWAVRSRANVLISGGTGAGKTTLLNTLARCIGTHERVVTIEDAAELRLGAGHVVRLESRPAMADGPAEITIRELVRNALRMRPDRIVVGEVRGPEALDMLQAMNTGHEGSLSTCHANGPSDAVSRLETMVLSGAVNLPIAAVRSQIAAAIDLIVHIERGADGTRRVVAIAEPSRDASGLLSLRSLAGTAGLNALPNRPVRRRTISAPQTNWLEDS